jgi:hypothetical protein
LYGQSAGYRNVSVEPDAAFYHEQLGEFILPYEAVRRSIDPEHALMAVLPSRCDAVAESGAWGRRLLERQPRLRGAR